MLFVLVPVSVVALIFVGTAMTAARWPSVGRILVPVLVSLCVAALVWAWSSHPIVGAAFALLLGFGFLVFVAVTIGFGAFKRWSRCSR